MCTTLTVKTIPVRTRLPLAAWVLAGLVTLFSFASTLVQESEFRACRAAHDADYHGGFAATDTGLARARQERRPSAAARAA